MTAIENKQSHHPKTFGSFIAFKEYFNFSGRRYQLIDTHHVKGKICLNVELVNNKHHTILNVLKVVSCVSLIIPLIMAVGIKIMRQKYFMILDKKHVDYAPDLHGARALSPRSNSLHLTQASSSSTSFDSSDSEPRSEEEVNSQDCPDTSSSRSRQKNPLISLCCCLML